MIEYAWQNERHTSIFPFLIDFSVWNTIWITISQLILLKNRLGKGGNCLCKVRIHSFLKTQKGLIPIISPLKSKTCIYSALSFCLRDWQIHCRTPSALYIAVKTLQRVMLYCYIANNTKIAQNKRYFNIFFKKMQDIRKKIAKS